MLSRFQLRAAPGKWNGVHDSAMEDIDVHHLGVLQLVVMLIKA